MEKGRNADGRPNGPALEVMGAPRGYVPVSGVVLNVTDADGKKVPRGVYVMKREDAGGEGPWREVRGVEIWDRAAYGRKVDRDGEQKSYYKPLTLWDGERHHGVDAKQAAMDCDASRQYLLRYVYGPDEDRKRAAAEAAMPYGFEAVGAVTLEDAGGEWSSPVLRDRHTGLAYVLNRGGHLIRYGEE